VNFVPIMVFAIVGTLISAAVISCGLHYLHKAGLLTPSAQSGPHQSMDGLTWAECWAFASLISATDPVSTLVLFAELRVEPHLFYLVFGESVMNDAVGLVLFDTAKDFITDPSLGTGRLFKAVGTFVLNLGGSLAVGILLTVLMAALVKHSQLKHNLVLEQGLVVLFVWLPYVVGEVLSLSGIVTTLTAGMAARKFIYVNLNEASQEGVVGMLRMLSNFAETAAFLNLGTTCVLHNRRYYNPALIAWSILLCCVSRPLQVYGLSSLMKCMGCLQRDLDTKTQRMLSFSGLRGVVAFACVTLWPNDPSVMDDEELDRRKIFVATTSVVILFTVFVQGGLTFQVLTWLKIDMGVDEDKLKVVEEKPGFVKWGSRFVDKWVAPIALSPLQMALQRASKADGIVSEEAWFAQQRGLHLDYSLGGGGGGGEVGNFSNGGVGGGPPSTAVASIWGRADGGNRLTSLPDDSEEGDDDAKAREQSLGGCGLTFSQSMSSGVDRKEGGMASGDGGAVVRDGQGGGNSFLSAVSVLSASSNQQSPNYSLNEPLLPQHQSEEAQPGTSHSSTGFERTTSARNSGSPRTTSSVSSVYDFGRHTARSCTQASADSDSLRKDKDFFARMTALAARSSSNNSNNNNNNNNNNNSDSGEEKWAVKSGRQKERLESLGVRQWLCSTLPTPFSRGKPSPCPRRLTSTRKRTACTTLSGGKGLGPSTCSRCRTS